MLSPEREAEIQALAAKYGSPERIRAVLEDAETEPLSMSDRIGEVCMVIRRPNGKLITAIKTFYPKGCFRLLTGGIKDQEPIEDALWREISEETGLQTSIARFLAVIEYADASPSNLIGFASFIFLLDADDSEIVVSDPDEKIDSFREIAVDELPDLAQTLEEAPQTYSEEVRGYWHAWGVFRAVSHHIVYASLA
jgi:NAD+ diphosphatase